MSHIKNYINVHSEIILNIMAIIVVLMYLIFLPISSNGIAMDIKFNNESRIDVIKELSKEQNVNKRKIHEYKYKQGRCRVSKNTYKHSENNYKLLNKNIHKLKLGNIVLVRLKYNKLLNKLHSNIQKTIMLDTINFGFIALLILYLIFVAFYLWIIIHYANKFYIVKYPFMPFLRDFIKLLVTQLLQLIAIYSISLNFVNILFIDQDLGTILIFYVPPITFMLLAIQVIIFMRNYKSYYRDQIFYSTLYYRGI